MSKVVWADHLYPMQRHVTDRPGGSFVHAHRWSAQVDGLTIFFSVDGPHVVISISLAIYGLALSMGEGWGA